MTSSRTVMPKPSVLPVLVFAWPMMSWWSRAGGRVSAWVGKGWVIPLSSRVSTIGSVMPKSAKVLCSRSLSPESVVPGAASGSKATGTMSPSRTTPAE